METFSALLALCAENSPATAEFPSQRPVTRSFDVFFDLRVNKRLSKRLWGWWFETPSRSLWRHCNATRYLSHDPALFWTHTFLSHVEITIIIDFNDQYTLSAIITMPGVAIFYFKWIGPLGFVR